MRWPAHPLLLASKQGALLLAALPLTRDELRLAEQDFGQRQPCLPLRAASAARQQVVAGSHAHSAAALQRLRLLVLVLRMLVLLGLLLL